MEDVHVDFREVLHAVCLVTKFEKEPITRTASGNTDECTTGNQETFCRDSEGSGVGELSREDTRDEHCEPDRENFIFEAAAGEMLRAFDMGRATLRGVRSDVVLCRGLAVRSVLPL